MLKLLTTGLAYLEMPSPTPTTDPANTFYSPGTVGFLAVMVAAKFFPFV